MPEPVLSREEQKARDMADFLEGKKRLTEKKENLMETEIKINTRPKSSTDCLIISEDSVINNMFDVIVTGLCIASGLVYANMAAFRIDVEGDNQYEYNDAKYYYIKGRDDYYIEIITQNTFIVEGIFMIDFIS